MKCKFGRSIHLIGKNSIQIHKNMNSNFNCNVKTMLVMVMICKIESRNSIKNYKYLIKLQDSDERL